jgi:hypothetical protein
MTGDWQSLKIRERRDLEFQSAENTAIVDSVGRLARQNKDEASDEKPRGPASWDTVRESKIKRARALVKDPNYPSKATLDAVADLLARNLGAKSRSR